MSGSQMAAGLPVGRALYLVFFALLSGCGGQSPPPFPPPEVSIATVRPRLVADWDDYTGRVQAVDTVEIRPRVAGYLSGVHFVEGALVEKGALLFTVDDREYLAAVEEARADLARAEARLEAAQKELTRADALIGQRAISQGEFDARQAEQRQARADQQAARAAVARADLHLSFTRIHAPIAGRAGEALATPGNLVVAGESLLTTVVSTDPVHVVFDAHEEAFLRYQRLPQQGKREVRIGITGEEGYPHRGELDFVDNVLNPSTGTLRSRAIVSNPEGRLTPGLFARVRLIAGPETSALLVHEQALLTDQDRRYVYVLDAENSARRQDVVLGRRLDGLRVVLEGLSEGDRVIVDGVRKIFFSGQPVNPREVPMEEPDAGVPAA